MTLFLGGDSAVPQPTLYSGHEVWGWYVAGDTPHVWTQAEVHELSTHGVNRTLPIAVPPQGENWWEENYGYVALEALVREAVNWGLPDGSPLVLDVEEGQAVQLNALTARVWAVAARTHLFIPWLYSGKVFLAKDQWCNKWLASWYGPAGTDHVPPPIAMPAEMVGWQYAGDVEGGRIDRDIFESGHTYLDPRAIGAKVTPGEAEFGTPIPEPAGQTLAGVTNGVVEPTEPTPIEPVTDPPVTPEPEPPAPEPAAQEVTATVVNDEPTADSKAKAALHAWVESFFA